MKSMLLIAFVFLVNCFGQSNANKTNFVLGRSCGRIATVPFSKHKRLEAIQKWTDVGVAVGVAVANPKDLTAIINVIGILGSAVPYLGPFTSVLSGLIGIFISKPDEFGEIKNKLNEMDGKLFAISNKLEELSDHVEQVSTLNYYKTEARKIDVVQKAYERYIATPTNITKRDLIRDCNLNVILEYINYVDREFSGKESVLSLLSVMKNDYDMNNFQYWSKMLVSSTSQAMMLHTVCMSVEHGECSELEETIRGDIKRFNDVKNNMRKVMQNGINDIFKNFINQANKEIENYAQANPNMGHQNFATNVRNKMMSKYFWRHWFASSWSGETGGYDQHTISNWRYITSWIRKYGRCAFIGSTNNDMDFNQKLNKCRIDKSKRINDNLRYNNHYAKYILDVIADCLGSYNGLAVVKAGNDQKITGNTKECPSYQSFYLFRTGQLEQFDIFSVAPEKMNSGGILK